MKKILIDETSDGWDEELQKLGYEAFSIKKLRKDHPELQDDFNVIEYAREHKMILVTKDKENGRTCTNNKYPCVWVNDNTIFQKFVLVELEKLITED